MCVACGCEVEEQPPVEGREEDGTKEEAPQEKEPAALA